MKLKLWTIYKTRDGSKVVLIDTWSDQREFWGICLDDPDGWISWDKKGRFDNENGKSPWDIVGKWKKK